jgi:hypothetical protein
MKRNKVYPLRLTEIELKNLHDMAESNGFNSASVYIRSRCLNKKVYSTLSEDKEKCIVQKESFIESTLPESYTPKSEPVKPKPKKSDNRPQTGPKFGFLDI